MFFSFDGAIIWVRFEKRIHRIEGEDDRPATGSRRPYGGRFCHFLRPGCGVPARPATIGSASAWRLDAVLRVSAQSMQSVDGFRLPLGASGGTASAGMTAVFIAGCKI